MVLLSVDSVTKHFGPEPVLAGVTFDVQPGERIGLVGPNGSGKTTLLTILAGDQQADSGTIRLHPSATARYLQQHVEFAPEQTVWDVALVALQKIAALSHEAEEVAAAIGQTTDELTDCSDCLPIHVILSKPVIKLDITEDVQQRPFDDDMNGRFGSLADVFTDSSLMSALERKADVSDATDAY